MCARLTTAAVQRRRVVPQGNIAGLGADPRPNRRCVCPAEPRGSVLAYLRGLPGQLERMFGWMLAEARFELHGIKPPTRSYTVT